MSQEPPSPAQQGLVHQGESDMDAPNIHVPDKLKVAIGLGAALIGAFTAYEAAQEGLDTTEKYANKLGAKIRNLKNRSDQPD